VVTFLKHIFGVFEINVVISNFLFWLGKWPKTAKKESLGKKKKLKMFPGMFLTNAKMQTNGKKNKITKRQKNYKKKFRSN
jgi:hypothetical protein